MKKKTLTKEFVSKVEKEGDSAIRKLGFKYLDQGAGGTVYVKDDLVLKSFEDPSYTRFVMAVQKLKKRNKYLPVFHEVEIFDKDCGVGIVVMERLDATIARVRARGWKKYVAAKTKEKLLREFDMVKLYGRYDKNIPKKLKEALQLIRGVMKKCKSSEDIHSKNVMVRRGKQLVIIDPLY